jgi:hypothetical protein
MTCADALSKISFSVNPSFGKEANRTISRLNQYLTGLCDDPKEFTYLVSQGGDLMNDALNDSNLSVIAQIKAIQDVCRKHYFLAGEHQRKDKFNSQAALVNYKIAAIYGSKEAMKALAFYYKNLADDKGVPSDLLNAVFFRTFSK